MGTKFEHAVDPLATSTKTNKSFFSSQYRVDDWIFFQPRKLQKLLKTNNINFIDSMDRMFEKHNIESIKKTMQIHEEIFKHQVQELHRLYSVQKKLMGELKKESIQNTNKRNINHSTTQTNSGYILHFQNVIDDDHARERSAGSCSRETTMKMSSVCGRRDRGGFDLERPAAAAAAGALEDNYISTKEVSAIDEAAAGPSNKALSIDHGNNEDINEVELTLSIGVSCKKKKKSEGYHHQLGCIIDDSPMSSSSATFDQENNKMPHWLLGLSINRS